ncbi:inner membrane transporter yfaV [Colletotrichum salicis]|uniref:Inner membrane transporter yfaV n=1 Tax=Colletotrichum salicis TaxID=1209931 RepID=A0A135UJ34_9PEZI|nr:inner membrane transporter yfaV [Colletotrichum salicis]
MSESKQENLQSIDLPGQVTTVTEQDWTQYEEARARRDQVILFGFVATMQVFLVDRKGFLASRMMLGLAEAGYIPGACYTLSTWYTKKDLAKRIAIFFFGMFSGNALSPILASGILKLGGERGLRGWQWLFLIEGIFTIFVGLSLLFLLPGSPDTPDPLLSPGLVRFKGSEKSIIQRRLEIDDKEKRGGAQGMRIPPKLVLKTVLHRKRWPHFLSSFAVFSTWSPLTTYTPTIFMNLGFNRIQANALAAVGASLALVVAFVFAYISDRTNKRGISVIGAQFCYLIVLIVARTAHPHVGKWSRWALWTAVNSFAVGYHPVNNSWVQLNCREPGEKSISNTCTKDQYNKHRQNVILNQIINVDGRNCVRKGAGPGAWTSKKDWSEWYDCQQWTGPEQHQIEVGECTLFCVMPSGLLNRPCI